MRRGFGVGVMVSLGLSFACSATPENVPIDSPAKPSVTVLLDMAGRSEARALAVIKQSQWLDPKVAGRELVKEVIQPGTKYVLLPSLAEDPTPGGIGELSGNLREDCGEYFLALAKPAAALAFGVVNTRAPARALPVESISVEPQHVAAVAKILENLGQIQVSPNIERTYRADIDADGTPETLLQAMHPDLAGDVERRPGLYSLLVVLSANPAVEPAYWGYVHGSDKLGGFRVVAFDTLADLDLDGKLEVLVRARHSEGWQMRAFHYRPDSGLTELFNSVGGERDCPDAAE